MVSAGRQDAVLYVQKGPATLSEMSGEEVRQALQRTKTILIPCGATEDHGPHLPLGTDSMEAREICRRTAVALESSWLPCHHRAGYSIRHLKLSHGFRRYHIAYFTHADTAFA